MKLQKSIIAIFALLICAATANAQFGDFINKAKNKIDKATKEVGQTTATTNQTTQTSGGDTAHATSVNSNQNFDSDDARWDLFKCKPQFTSAVNEDKLREIIQYNMNNDYGNGGLIVFTKQPLAKKNATLDDSIMIFKAGEPIYLNVVLKEPLKIDDYGIYLESRETIMTVGDTKQCANGYFKYSIFADYGRFDKMLPQTSTFDFQPQGGRSAKYQQQIKVISEELRALPAGVHIVPVRLSGSRGGLAVGAFYYDNRDGKGNDDAIKNAMADVKMPAASVKFAAIEKAMVAELNKMPGGRVLRAVVTDRDWMPLRHEISGVLIGRAITAVLAIKTDEGGCFRETQSWIQDYNGSSYTNLHLSGTRDRQDMACENVMK